METETQEVNKRVRKIRYAYVVLALISVLCGLIAVEVSLKAISSNNQNFCDLTTSFASPAPVKPTDPAHDRRSERTWIVYNKVLRLSGKLGCIDK